MALDLLTAAATFIPKFFESSGGSGKKAPPVKEAVKFASSFLGMGKKRGKDLIERRPIEYERPRSVKELVERRPFQPLGNMRFITGAENADIQNAMRVLANARNNQVAQLVPYSAINYKGGPPPNISVGSTNLASKKIRNDIT